MGLTQPALDAALDALARNHAPLALALEAVGRPAPRVAARGYVALLRALVAQQLSVKAAASILARLEAMLGDLADAPALLAADEAALRACGLSGGKIRYGRALAEAVTTGALDFAALPTMDDESAIRAITAIHGFGRWSAEVYLLFAEGRPDVFPAGDLALKEAARRLLRLDARPSEQQLRGLAEQWRPHRGAMAVFLWHYYACTPAI